MPELPEVETVRRSLAPLAGREVAEVIVREARLRRPLAEDFADRMRGARVETIDRRGKYLLLRLDRQQTLLAHLGMTGTLALGKDEGILRPHDHVIFRLTAGGRLVFHDPRRFGCLELGQGDDFDGVRSLGPEPLDPGLNPAWLHGHTRRRRCPIKNLLLDQRVVAGIGNIYASEMLFEAGIRPGRAAVRLTRAEVSRLFEAMQRVLRHAIELGGSSISDYRDADGKPGYFQLAAAVYDREGHPCRRCEQPIRRIVQAGRSSFYCRQCQR